jgi:hypothetical protein
VFRHVAKVSEGTLALAFNSALFFPGVFGELFALALGRPFSAAHDWASQT